jgi:hypothetical protein
MWPLIKCWAQKILIKCWNGIKGTTHKYCPTDTVCMPYQVERQLCVRIAPENLHLPSPLTTFGEFELPLRFPKSIPLPEGKVQWTLAVKVRGK